MNRWIFVIIPLLGIACHESFIPEIETATPYLTVEGNIGTQDRNYYVRLTSTELVNNVSVVKGLEGAEVYVSDQEGNEWQYQELRNGNYRFQPQATEVAKIGSSYTLHIITPDGNQFVSEPQQVLPCPPLDTLYCKATIATTHPVDIDGNVQTEKVLEMSIHYGTQGVLPEHNYFFYKYRALEQHKSEVSESLGSMMGETRYEYRRRYVSDICVANADDFSENRIPSKELFSISVAFMEQYYPDVEGEQVVTSTVFRGLVFELEQYSISSDAYQFYSDARVQLDADGRLFDPVASDIRGNISCITQPDYPVVGAFYASDITTRAAIMYVGRIGNNLEADLTRNIEDFPFSFDEEIPDDAYETWITLPVL